MSISDGMHRWQIAQGNSEKVYVFWAESKEIRILNRALQTSVKMLLF